MGFDEELYGVILERMERASPDSSYVARLSAKGEDAVFKKVGEEAVETVLALKGGDRDEIVYEAADLIFHLYLALAFRGVTPSEVWGELRERFGKSGLRRGGAE